MNEQCSGIIFLTAGAEYKTSFNFFLEKTHVFECLLRLVQIYLFFTL